ncbi:MAG: SDR family oxidoreductase [Legionella sp.]|nr:SDR family oxidoreductase [Legionella sp.]
MHRKVALVTGAARRIGAAISQRLHRAGYDVIVHCNQSVVDGEALVDAFNAQQFKSAHLLRYDLRQKGAVSALIADALQWKGRLDLLVNNASVFYRNQLPLAFTTHTAGEPQAEQEKKEAEKAEEANLWADLFHLNVRVPFLLSQYAYESLKTHQGAIINLTDIHANKPLKHYAIYCQTKAALVMQTKALAREFAPHVRVNAVAPGAVAWPEYQNQLTQAVQDQIVAQTPLKRHGNPIYVAEAVLALATNAFITGQVLNVDGGRSII